MAGSPGGIPPRPGLCGHRPPAQVTLVLGAGTWQWGGVRGRGGPAVWTRGDSPMPALLVLTLACRGLWGPPGLYPALLLCQVPTPPPPWHHGPGEGRGWGGHLCADSSCEPPPRSALGCPQGPPAGQWQPWADLGPGVDRVWSQPRARVLQSCWRPPGAGSSHTIPPLGPQSPVTSQRTALAPSPRHVGLEPMAEHPGLRVLTCKEHVSSRGTCRQEAEGPQPGSCRVSGCPGYDVGGNAGPGPSITWPGLAWGSGCRQGPEDHGGGRWGAGTRG